MEPEPQEHGIPPEGAAVVVVAHDTQWLHTRYGRWQQEQHREPGLGLALLRLALASLSHPRLAADAPEAARELATDVLGEVVAALSRAVGF